MSVPRPWERCKEESRCFAAPGPGPGQVEEPSSACPGLKEDEEGEAGECVFVLLVVALLMASLPQIRKDFNN